MLYSDQRRGIRQTLLLISGGGRAIRTLDDRSTTHRTIGMRIEPQSNTSSMEGMLARRQLLHFFPLCKHRQTHRALTVNIFDKRVLLIRLNIRNHLPAADVSLGLAGESPGGAPVAPSERVRRALHGVKAGVDQGWDGNHGDKSENEFERGQVDAARRCRKGRGWYIEYGGCVLHDGEEWYSLWLWLLSFPFLFFLFLAAFSEDAFGDSGVPCGILRRNN